MTKANTFLRRLLYADFVISAVSAVTFIAGAQPIGRLLGLPSNLLLYSGFGLVPFALLVLYCARRDVFPTGGVWTVIAINALWAVASGAMLLAPRISPSTIGYVFVIGQAIAIAALAEMEYVGLRRVAAA